MSLFTPFDTAARLSDCVCAVLKSEDRGDDVWAGQCCVWPGSRAPIIDCCENGGQMSVNVVNGYPTTSFPTPTTTPQDCGQTLLSWATVYEIKVTRCIPVSLDCDCECKEDAANKILGDLQAVLQGVVCCFTNDPNDECAQFSINGWRLLEPQGGCSGVVVTVTAESDAICCPPEETQ